MSLLDCNPKATITPPTKRFERLQDKIQLHNHSAGDHNAKVMIETKYHQQFRGKTLVFCTLCDGQVTKKKINTIDIGHNLKVRLPHWKCSVCGASYIGFIPNLRHQGAPEIKPEIVNWTTAY